MYLTYVYTTLISIKYIVSLNEHICLLKYFKELIKYITILQIRMLSQSSANFKKHKFKISTFLIGIN